MGGTSYTEPPVNPPRAALASSAGSAGASGLATTVAVALTFAWTLALQTGPAGGGGAGYEVAKEVARINVPLASGLMLAAVVLAGLALAFTALSMKRETDPARCVEVSIRPLATFILLNLLGLSFDALALALLAQGRIGGFRIAGLVGTLLEIGAVIVGVGRRMAAARELEAAHSRPAARTASRAGS